MRLISSADPAYRRAHNGASINSFCTLGPPYTASMGRGRCWFMTTPCSEDRLGKLPSLINVPNA
jgi:hypothetical protein